MESDLFVQRFTSDSNGISWVINVSTNFNPIVYFLIFFFISVPCQNADNSIALVIAIFLFCWSFSLLAFVCELCDRLTSAFGEIDYEIGQLNYHLLPMEIQRIIPIILMNVQKAVVLECFGNIYCDRMAFKKVYAALKTSCGIRINTTKWFNWLVISGGKRFIIIFYGAP